MKTRRRFFLVLVAMGVAMFDFPAEAQRGRGIVQDEAKEPADKSETIRPSGLEPVFPEKVRCPEIASPFGSRTRYDGSSRPSWAPGGGSHGGIDITLAAGTPLLALAAGTVVAKGEGVRLLGISMWLSLSPEETGLPDWVFSKYQHLETLPELSIGAKVSLGQVIGRSGKTGTTGGHYGFNGYPHLHLTTLRSAEGEYQIEGSRVISRDGRIFDPLALYHEAGVRMERTAGMPPSGKGVVIPYVAADGRAWPANTRVVWPIACPPR